MADRSAAFLEEVLGKDGAAALLKAVQRSPALASVLVPRAIIGWTMAATAWGYSGKLPGTDLEVGFHKSENPGRYGGSIQDSKSNGLYVFNDAPFHRIAAHIAVALEVPEVAPASGLKDLDLARLGKSIDALAKAQLLAQATAPTVMSSHGDLDVIHAGVGQTPYSLRRRKDGRVLVDKIGSLADAQRLADWQMQAHPEVPGTHPMDKVELPGSTAKPTPQQGPAEALPPQKQPRQQRPPAPAADGKGPGVKAPPRTKEQMPSAQAPQVPSVKVPSMKIGKSEAHASACPVCKQLQFGPDGGFYGCLCFRGMCQDVVVKAEADGYELTFGDIWDEDARSALLEALRPT